MRPFRALALFFPSLVCSKYRIQGSRFCWETRDRRIACMTTPSSDDVRVVCRIRGGGEFSPDAADGPPPPPSEGSVAVGNDGKSVVIAAALGVGDGVGYRFDAVIDDRRQTTTPPSKRPLGARPTGDEPTGQDVSGCASSYVSSQAAVFDQHARAASIDPRYARCATRRDLHQAAI